MRLRKSTLILSFILASLLFYIFAIDLPSERKKREETKLIPWGEGDITYMELKVKSKKLHVKMNRLDKDRWQIEFPVSSEADDLTMNLTLSALKDAKKEKVADSGDPKDYGLDSPEIELTCGNQKGEKMKFLLGKEHPITGERFLMVEGDKAIYLVSSYVYKQLDTDLYSIRKKDMIPENTIAIRSFTLSYAKPPREFSFKRNEQSLWDMVSPVSLPISQDKIADILWDIVEGKADEIVDNPKDLKDYGLDSPHLVVKLVTEKNKEYNVLFSWTKDEKSVWGMVSGGQSVYRFGRYVPKSLRVRSVDDLLDKRPLRSSYYTLESLIIEYPNGNKVTLRKENEKWVGVENADSWVRELTDIESVDRRYKGEIPLEAKLAFRVIAKDATKEVRVEFYETSENGWVKDLDYPIVYKLDKTLEELLPNVFKK